MNKSAEDVSNEFYCAIGRATTAWHFVEDGMRDIFSRIVFCSISGTADPIRAAHPKAIWIVGGIFYSSTNIRGRLDMISEMIEFVAPDTSFSDRWNSLRNKVLRIYKRRNTLAHSHAWGNETRGITAIQPHPFAGTARSMNLSQVLAAERSFLKTGEQLTQFAVAINKHLVAAYPPKRVP